MRKFVAVLALSCLTTSLAAMAQHSPLWIEDQAKLVETEGSNGITSKGQLSSVNSERLTQIFADKSQKVLVDIPLPQGGTAAFTLTPAPVMAKQLAAKFPELMSYQGRQVNTPENTGRFNISPAGLSGMFKLDGEWVFLSPQTNTDDNQYLTYYRKDARTTEHKNHKQNDVLRVPDIAAKSFVKARSAARTSGDVLRTYRLAVSTSGEYTQANGGVNGAMAELDRLINRVNQIFLTDLSIQFELVANNDLLIFEDAATDPFTNSDSEDDLESNQETVDDVIGTANYDIGHLLNTNGGGLAFVGVTCLSNFKAQGYTGSSRPSGESFYIDLVIHELGHQLGARHTFNATESGSCTGGSGGQRNNSSSVEPASGSTIMAYAGICNPQNLQNNSDPYFHPWSITQIQQSLDRFDSCGTVTDPDNAVPVAADLTADYTIPANTPFLLTALATDADNDALTFGWDQINPGDVEGATPTRASVGQDNGFNPLFRSFTPTTNPTRYFPMLDSVLEGTSTFGEALPSTNRTLNFEVVIRDNVGGVDTKQVSVNVVDTGAAFSVTQPAAGTSWIGSTMQTVEWETAGTELSPIACSSVDILLDVDGDNQFNTVLASGVTNDGFVELQALSAVSDNARLMLKCTDSVFYAVNPGAFSLTSGLDPIAPVITGQSVIIIDEDTSRVLSFADLTVDDPDSNYPEGFTLTILTGNNYSVDGTTITPSPDFNGQLSIDVSVNDGTNDSNVFSLSMTISPVNDAPVAVNDSASVAQGSGATNIDVLANDSDADGDDISISNVQYSGTGSLNISDNQLSYTPLATFSGTETASYSIQDPSGESATATVSLRVTAPRPPSTDDGGSGGSLVWLLAGLLASLGFRYISFR